MEKEEYNKMYSLEQDYWWFRGKRELINYWISSYYSKKDIKLKILDIGCGTGTNTIMLKKYGEVHGLDFSKDALKFCSERNLKNLSRGSAEMLPFKDKSFNIVAILDVLYHKNIKNDQSALKEIKRILKKDGRLFLTDAAIKFLCSKRDKLFHIKRRYWKKELSNKLKNEGFKIEKISYFNIGLFIPILIMRKISDLSGITSKSDIQEINPLFNKILYWYYIAELSLLKHLNYPFGVSIFIVGKKV